MPNDIPGAAVGSSLRALSVAELLRSVRDLLERRFPLAWVRGELSNLSRAPSGHCYFTLKDRAAQVECVMFRGRAALLDWEPRDGMQVEVRALATLYEPRGRFQLTVETMRRAGLGPLYERFLRLKEELGADGLFDEGIKRALPAHPRRIGVLTSLAAAALRDVLTTLARRNAAIEVIIYPVPVQGDGAAGRIAAMLARASRGAECDVLLLVRGGGSIEDLWQFNEEAVARAIRACGIPVVVGVGHETDFTIADFAADRRAPTPTAAAELVSPPRAELAAHPLMAALGPEPLGNAFDAALLAEACRGKKTSLKAALSDQKVVAGLGNTDHAQDGGGDDRGLECTALEDAVHESHSCLGKGVWPSQGTHCRSRMTAS